MLPWTVSSLFDFNIDTHIHLQIFVQLPEHCNILWSWSWIVWWTIRFLTLEVHHTWIVTGLWTRVRGVLQYDGAIFQWFSKKMWIINGQLRMIVSLPAWFQWHGPLSHWVKLYWYRDTSTAEAEAWCSSTRFRIHLLQWQRVFLFYFGS